MSPANVPSSAPTQMRKRVAGAGSDTDAGMSDRDGGLMSDGSRARKIKLKMSVSPPATGPPSRTASPAPGARSPLAASSPLPTAFPSVQDIKSAIPESGIAIKDLMKIVAHPKERRAEFVNLVKEVARIDKERNVLVLK